MISDVALWFARNSTGEIKTINEVKYHDDTYYCPLCNSEVIPKALKENSKVTEHFAHLDKSKCTPESMIHWWYKNKFLQCGDKFIVTTDKTHQYVCKDILVEKNYHTEYGDYKPDVTVITESGDTVYFEYAFTNKKKIKDYLNQWLELGNIVVEVNLKTLLQANYGKDTYKFNALFYKGKCFNTNKRDLYYKTIGKYKECEYSNKAVDMKKKKEIETLDWFWNSVQEYKLNKLTDEELYTCFDEATDVNSNLVIDILNKSKCTQILNDCTKHKVTYIYNNIIDYTNSKNKDLAKFIKYNIIYYVHDRLYADISILDLTDNCNFGINIFNYSYNEIMRQAKDAIDNDIEYYPTYLKIQEYENTIKLREDEINVYFKNFKLNDYIKDIESEIYDFNYSFSGGKYSQDLLYTYGIDIYINIKSNKLISCSYNNNYNSLTVFRYSYDISKDDFRLLDMCNDFKNKMMKYFSNLDKIVNVNQYKNLAFEIDNYYNTLPIHIKVEGWLSTEYLYCIEIDYKDEYYSDWFRNRYYISNTYVFNENSNKLFSKDLNLIKHFILNDNAKSILKIMKEI